MNWLLTHFSNHATALQKGEIAALGVLLSADILIIFSLVSVAVMFERALHLRRARQAEDEGYAALRHAFQPGSTDVSTARGRLAGSAAPFARAVQNSLDFSRREARREAVTQGVEVQNALLNRNLAILATIASTAPYVGLFGTVLGILRAFAKIAQTGQTGASTVAAPIAEALTATALGLGVAIPAVVAYNFFASRVGDLVLRVETHALDIAARLESLEDAAPNFHAPQNSTMPPMNGTPVHNAPMAVAAPVAAPPVAAPVVATSATAEGVHAH